MALPQALIYALLLSAAVVQRNYAANAQGQPVSSGKKEGSRQLQRSSGRRWDSIHEVVRAEIKSATRHFLEERSRAMILPIEVDLLLVGFDGDGGYGYTLDRHALDEMLGTATEDNTICPTVWETGESAAVCYSVNYITLDSSKVNKGIERMESALVHNMELVGDRSKDWPDGSKDVNVYEVEANGEIEATVWELLDEAYEGKEPEVNRRQHSQIVIINPSKLRMKSALPPPPGHAPDPPEVAHQNTEAASKNFLEEWKKGTVGSSHVVEQEAGFLYRYRYHGRGGAAAFVGQYNFLVIDISAGPVSYGPLVSPSGAVTPTGMPRLMPMLLRMTRELESNTKVGTLREHLLHEAVEGQAAVFTGQLASTIASATRHLFATDFMMAVAEGLGGPTYEEMPKRVVVSIIVLQDHIRELEHEPGSSSWVDTDMVQLALDEMLPPEVQGAVSVTRHMLHHHKQLASALVKAKHSRSDAVLLKPPDAGLHRSLATSLDSTVLLRELRLAASDDDLMAALTEQWNDDYAARLSYGGDDLYGESAAARRKRNTKVLPVFVFSLQRAPDHLMFDNQQLVAAGGDVVAVLQLLGSPSVDSDASARGRTYSGHMAESHHLHIDASDAPTRSIIAGLATSLGGMVPAQQRYCRAERAVVEDWRWSVGAVPWGPYSDYTALSSVFAATVRRNLLVARIEKPLRRLTAALNHIDDFIVRHLQAPFAYLRHPAPSSGAVGPDGLVPLHEYMPHHHLLDDLVKLHLGYQTKPNRTKAAVQSAAKPAATPSPPPHPEPADHFEGHFDIEGHQDAHHDYPDSEHSGEDDDNEPYDHPVLLPPDVVVVGGAANPEHLVVQQDVLTPNVAQRLQQSLTTIGSQLEQLSFQMYSREWAELEDMLPDFAASVAAFVAAVDRDLRHAAEVISCCEVTHVPRGTGTWFAVAVVLVVLGAFAILAFVAIRSQRLYSPRLGLGGPARTPSRGRSLSGSLPSWSGPSGVSLPR